MYIVKKLIFIVHSKRSNNHDDLNENTIFNVNQLHSISQFLRTNFQEVNYNERAFYYHKGEKNK